MPLLPGVSGWLQRVAPGVRNRIGGAAPRALSRVSEVGWLVDTDSAAFIYPAPRPLSRSDSRGERVPDASPKGVNHCPAVIDVESKTFVVGCPVDLNLALRRDDKGQVQIVNRTPREDTTVNSQHLAKMVTVLGPSRWRDPKRPVLQIAAPYRFIADEPVWMNQLPPYGHFVRPPWPGVLVTGRFPIDVWPRSLLWAFEWHDTAAPLVIRRGDPWFYVRFETMDPGRPVRLVEAEMTPTLRQHCNGIDAVTNYVSQTFSLFEEARSRRPPRLLTKAPRRKPEAESA